MHGSGSDDLDEHSADDAGSTMVWTTHSRLVQSVACLERVQAAGESLVAGSLVASLSQAAPSRKLSSPVVSLTKTTPRCRQSTQL